MTRWRPGDNVVLREIWRGRVWNALPCTVVHDADDLLMLFIPPGTTWKYAADADGRELRLYADEWTLVDHVATRPVLSFSQPGVDHAVLAMWDDEWQFTGWYINLEDAARRTPVGFDFTDHCLDVLVTPDRSTWTWKDEDELEEAVRRGIFTQDDARAFREEGERAVKRLMDGEPPFDRDWSTWRPDASWRIPALEPGWDLI